MPPELVGIELPPPEGMTPLTLPLEYLEVLAAHDSGLLPEQFRMLSSDEQAELMAFHQVRQFITNFYRHEQEILAEERRKKVK